MGGAAQTCCPPPGSVVVNLRRLMLQSVAYYWIICEGAHFPKNPTSTYSVPDSINTDEVRGYQARHPDDGDGLEALMEHSLALDKAMNAMEPEENPDLDDISTRYGFSDGKIYPNAWVLGKVLEHKAAGESVLIYATHLLTCMIINSILDTAGVRTLLVSSQQKPAERRVAMDRFNHPASGFDALITSSKLSCYRLDFHHCCWVGILIEMPSTFNDKVQTFGRTWRGRLSSRTRLQIFTSLRHASTPVKDVLGFCELIWRPEWPFQPDTDWDIFHVVIFASSPSSGVFFDLAPG
ncbi:hypothetical protein B0I35DRAFT_406145 [Stachybotrys elegans]|uniref:Helicase C-terminal domain-containing protein n=1 Tax=Stachybotrys elegans TaxID=80388 RepID=A0A8K0SWT6_9HYPO|nr:hypothetical protein B0I35DRAFT_406145 [Stachybotrys elegans]